ncbi:trypsin-like serine peptidase [Mesorhizobium australicum]|uniref:trypsin-like serine peptidase n=1 Tax=Mesorhizobium australicum TaxID=536018 RepID=UPI003339BDFC
MYLLSSMPSCRNAIVTLALLFVGCIAGANGAKGHSAGFVEVGSIQPIEVTPTVNGAFGVWAQIRVPQSSSDAEDTAIQIRLVKDSSSTDYALAIFDDLNREVARYNREYLRENAVFTTKPVMFGALTLKVIADQRPSDLELRIEKRFERPAEPAVPLSPSILLRSINILVDGSKLKNATHSVAKILINGIPCTGFLVAPDILVTNYHCVKLAPSIERGKLSNACNEISVVFDYFADAVHVAPTQGRCLEIKQDWLDSNGDIALLRVGYDGVARDPLPLANTLIFSEPRAFVLEHVAGRPLRVAGPCEADGDSTRAPMEAIEHHCTTLGGSSGSPIMTESGLVFGMNRAGQVSENLTLGEYVKWVADHGSEPPNLGVSSVAIQQLLTEALNKSK